MANINNKKRIKYKLIIGFLAIILGCGVVALIMYFQSIKPIKIGEIEITKQQFEKNSSDLSKYLKDNPGISYGDGNPEEIARDDLILNAALKDYSKLKCGNKTYTNKDLYRALNYYDEISEDEAKKVVESAFSQRGDFERVRVENDALKKILYSCVNKVKEIYSVSIIYDSFYFNRSETQEEYDNRIAEAKKKLEDTFLEKFKAGLPKEEIEKYVNVGYKIRGDKYIPEFDYDLTTSTYSNLFKWSNKDGGEGYYVYNDIPNHKYGDKKFSVNAVSMNEVVDSLKKVGEYKGVNIGQDGEISIVRLESVSGEFDDWDSFLDSYKNKISNEDRAYADKWHGIVTLFGFSFKVNGYGGIGVDRKQYSAYDYCRQGGVAHNVLIVYNVRIQGKAGYLNKPGVVHAAAQQNGIRQGEPGSGNAYCTVESHDDNNANGQVRAAFSCSLGGDAASGYNTRAYLSVTINPGYTREYAFISAPYARIPYSKNNTKQHPGDIVIRELIQPPPDQHDQVSQRSSVKTEVRLEDRGGWQTGTISAKVGSTVNFKHVINGDFRSKFSNYNLDWRENNTEVLNRNVGRHIGLGNGASGDIVVQGDTFGTRNDVRVTPIRTGHSDVGKTICENINYTWNLQYQYKKGVVRDGRQAYDMTRDPSRDRQGNGSSTPACVYIPYNYELTPCAAIRGVSECGGRTIPKEPGSSTPVEPTVDNPNGNTPSRPDTQWIITTWEVDGNDEDKPTPNDKIDNTDNNPCHTYDIVFRGTGSGSIAKNCNSSERGTGKFDPGKKTKVGGDKHLVIPSNAPLGKRYCIGLSVSPYKLRENESKESQDNFVGNQWRHSAPICVMATKKPKLQIWGNGIYSNAGIRTSRSRYEDKGLFGSWVEYEAISNGSIDRFASESSREGSNLTFANRNGTDTTVRGNWGQWNGATNIDNVIANINGRYPSSRDGVNIEAAGASYGEYNGNGTPNIHTHIIRREGNLFLTGNIITKNPTGNGVNKFQQNIIIVNGDLTISQDVTQIDAWLIVTGTITTCVPKNTGVVNQNFVNNDNCGKSLRVNGPVIAGNLNPWRTGASDYNNPNTPSEIFNQRPDIYLWAAHQGSARTKAITTYDKELPARY